jgi:ABC-type multidrug transport system ATPase subunit
MISFRDVEFRYGKRPAVFRASSLDIGPGLTLVLGPNGAGKSTLLKLAAGIEQPTTGRVTVGHHDLWRDEVAARRSLAYVPEQPDITPYATVSEVLSMVASLREVPPSAVSSTLAETGLTDVGTRSIRELSMGQRRRVLIAAARIGAPSTLLLDEPLETMDRDMRAQILAWVTERISAGGTVVVATHEIGPFTPLATRAVQVDAGVPRVIEPYAPTI